MAANDAIPNGSDEVGGVLNGLLKGLLLFSIAGMGEVFFMLFNSCRGGNAGGGNVGEATKIAAGAVDGAERTLADLAASSALGSKSSSLNPSWKKKVFKKFLIKNIHDDVGIF